MESILKETLTENYVINKTQIGSYLRFSEHNILPLKQGVLGIR